MALVFDGKELGSAVTKLLCELLSIILELDLLEDVIGGVILV